MSISEIIHFLKEGVWKVSLKDLSARKSVLIKNLRIVLLASKGFNEDKCALRAKALTFYSLMSIVPLVAFGFGIAKGFGMQEVLEKEFRSFAAQVQIVGQIQAVDQNKDTGQAQVLGQDPIIYEAKDADQNQIISPGQVADQNQAVNQIVDNIIGFANNMLNETKGGLIAGIGIVFLLYTVFNLMQNIEGSFNDIWGISHSRSFSRKLSDYLSALFIVPILFILSSGITVFVNKEITPITDKIILLGPIISALISMSLRVLPFFLIWLLLIFLYVFMPNTRVRFWSSLMGAVVAGTIYVFWQIVYIALQTGATKYGAIYGSLAALPLFMIWLHVSWLIVLFGAEITFAHQNVDTYEMEPLSETVSVSLKRILSLRIVNICIKNFVRGEEPWAAGKISEFLELPVRLTNKLLSDLVKCHVLSETEGADEKISYYQPARDVNSLTIHYVTRSLEKLGNDDISFADSEEIDKIKKSYERLDTMFNESNENILLKDI